MKSKQEIDRLTNATLNSLVHLQQVEANEFLYGKIINRMQLQEQNQRAGNRRLMLRLSFGLVLFAGLNLVSFYVFQHQQVRKAKPAKSAAAAFAEEYSLGSGSYNY